MKITFTKEEYEWLIFEAKQDGVQSMSDFDLWVREEYLPYVLFSDSNVVGISIEL